MAKSKLTPSVSLTFLQDLVRHYLDLTDEIEHLRAEQEKLDLQLRMALEVTPDKTAETAAGVARLVESDVVTYDLETLTSILPPDVLERVTHRHVDKDLVEAAAALRTIPPEVLDRARRVHKRKPQLRVRR
ncbi:MAG TPA: hypothetical protein V6D05_02710 [Stenomitos sp.]